MDDSALVALRENDRLWKLFTRHEEYDPVFVDEFERFRYFSATHRNPFEPEVSAYLVDNGWRVAYPDDKPYAICLTHDIDSLHFNRYRITRSNAVLRARRAAAQWLDAAVTRSLKRHDPSWNMLEIADLEARYGAKSTFFCLALGLGDRDYSFEAGEIAGSMRELLRRGWDVGLHGGHEAYRDVEAIKREKRRLESVLEAPVTGYRNHYLRFRTPDTWRLLSEAGFRYDTTFGYADCIGFRNGMCHPFHPFDLSANERMPILEIPLTVMDTTLKSYMRLDAEASWRLISRLLETVARYNGVITFLWHPASFVGRERDLYERILRHGSETNAWLTSAGALADWWANKTP
jgi:peptidoglycan/xylan/chitin deacetylase (PgdA/CDA1 family)